MHRSKGSVAVSMGGRGDQLRISKKSSSPLTLVKEYRRTFANPPRAKMNPHAASAVGPPGLPANADNL